MKVTARIETHIKKFPVRLALSVVAGIAAAKVLTTVTDLILHWAGVFPPLTAPMFDKHLLLISLLFHSVYSITGGYITAGIARERARKAVIILGSKEAILWLLGTLLLWKHSPPWFNITKALAGIPLAVLGGQIYIWHRGNQGKDIKSGPPNTSQPYRKEIKPGLASTGRKDY